MTATSPFGFERAAASYDRLRAYPPLIARQLGQRLVEVVGRGARVLELGVGTGRIAVPLTEAGAHVVGVDLSAAMLESWVAKPGGADGAVQGDVTQLPFAAQRFDGALAVHVLHLVKDVEVVIGEVRRVLRPGKPLLLGSDWRDPDVIDERLRNQWRRFVAEMEPHMRPPGGSSNAQASLLDHLRESGAEVDDETMLLEWRDHVSAATELDRIATRQHSESWALPDELLQRSVEQLNTWLFAQQIDPHAMNYATRQFRLVVVRWPSGVTSDQGPATTV